ncbi:3 beta-hydroxysteroid dehydrogenase type 7 [Nerophis lumbriciformis]|uniref:3 beta-hydroxysteroid dehydrogenase type 7 n=1 Tax=Nerophis lumbriciformis TaxID=546530 RepID=UPI002AE096B1|nr:3 beta-hydroxysteroid dehydrogenase type 7-like [Nerophis lumbriciformis]
MKYWFGLRSLNAAAFSSAAQCPQTESTRKAAMSRARPALVYLVTGGCGFLGRHLLRLLLEKEDRLVEVRVFDKHTDDSLEGLGTDRTKVTVIQGDITDYQSVLAASRGADVIIHAAGLVDVWHKVPEDLIYAVNVKGTENVIRACVENNICSLVYTSSMEVIGPNMNREPFVRGNENTPYQVKHTMAYPKSKAKAEKIVLEANGIKVKSGERLHTCSLRPTGIYGEGHELIKDFYRLGVKRGGVIVLGVPETTEHGRVYVGNVAWMHVLAARALVERLDKVGGEAFFCYDDSPYKSYEDFNMIFLATFNFRRVRMPLALLWLLAALNDVLRWVLWPVCNFTPLLNSYTLSVASTSFTVNTDKALRHFQYRPLYNWDECRERTQKWVDTFPLENSKDA